ncbi:hypothetical protein [Herbidospora mongoliensis]|uniref:hypothetical protein n=1 Tax=Herbidospora mongoliensis TaxID=688067 RepID=UPI00082B0030|nr:hypothetical protein [Herbidospora mongoliensis]
MDPISSLSKVPIGSLIKGADGTGTVEFALLDALDANPAGGDWKTGRWGATTKAGAQAYVDVGPDTDFELTPGTWVMWVRVNATQSTPVFRAGLVDVF